MTPVGALTDEELSARFDAQRKQYLSLRLRVQKVEADWTETIQEFIQRETRTLPCSRGT
ncbi:MAG: hypothetical protein ACREBU_10150 [Nitrososphaera sp.]